VNRRRLLRAGVALAATAVAGCLSGGSSGPVRVSMTTEFAFDPARVTVDAGATVTWVNDSGVAHTVTADDDTLPPGAAYFASGGYATERAARTDLRDGLIAPDETYAHAFETRGTYEYVCLPHEGSGMTGSVVVR
jgi:Plastocyanin